MAHLVSADKEVRELLLVDGPECMSLSAKLKALGRPHLLLGLDQIAGRLAQNSRGSSRQDGILSRWKARLFGSPSAQSNFVVVISPLHAGLHINLERLRSAVYEDILRLAAFSDGILVFYGKCGNSLADLESEFSSLPCQLYFLNDEKGERIDDCIAAALGGNEIYGRILAEHQDVALFMTPMWAANWSAMEREEFAYSGKEDLRSMLKKRRSLTKVARIDTGLCYEKGFNENVEGFARQFGLQKIELAGGTAVAENSYTQAKRRMMACQAMHGDQNCIDQY